MSKQLTKKLLKEVFRIADGKSTRKQLTRNKHIVTITLENIKESYRDSYNRVLEKSPDLPDPKGWKIFDFAAKAAIKDLENHLKDPKTKSYFAPGSIKGRVVVYTSNKNSTVPLEIIKKTGVRYVNRKLKQSNKTLTDAKSLVEQNPGMDFSAAAQASQVAQFKTGIEIHHKGTTIGAAQLTKAFAFLETSKYFSDFMSSEEITSLRDMFGDFDLMFQTDSDLNVSIKEDYLISVDIGSYRKNFGGSEPNDWKNIKPKLEEAISSWASKQDWWNRKGSKSLKEDSLELTAHTVVSTLTKARNVTATKKTKKPKRSPAPVKTVIAGTSKRRVKNSKATPARGRTRKPKSTGFSQVKLYAALNTRINAVVAKNMDLPGLEYQTGRFASGVKITDVSKTAQGFPSVGYTYQLYPYQTFEPGFAQGSTDRDPRKLIDRSIREIAAEMVTGRLYTRRQ